MRNLLHILLIFVLLLLAGCKLPAPEDGQATGDPASAAFTAAAQTADARAVLRPAGTETFTPEPSKTPAPSATLAAETPLAPPAQAVTQTVSATEAGAASTAVAAADRGEFVEDISVPDGEAHAPGELFTKTWRLKNTGETTWTTEYSLVFISGALMDAPASVSLPIEVGPGETVDISVEMTAPAEAGTYQGFWKLRNAAGQIFGVGPAATDAIWVTITVNAALASTTTVTVTPVGKVVASLSVAVDQADKVGMCPQTFRFTVQFSLSKASTVTYSLEAGSDEGVQIKLPPPAIRNMDVGAHSVVYELTFSNSLHGWVRVHFTQPEDVTSKQAKFSLVCQQPH